MGQVNDFHFGLAACIVGIHLKIWHSHKWEGRIRHFWIRSNFCRQIIQSTRHSLNLNLCYICNRTGMYVKLDSSGVSDKIECVCRWPRFGKSIINKVKHLLGFRTRLLDVESRICRPLTKLRILLVKYWAPRKTSRSSCDSFPFEREPWLPQRGLARTPWATRPLQRKMSMDPHLLRTNSDCPTRTSRCLTSCLVLLPRILRENYS